MAYDDDPSCACNGKWGACDYCGLGMTCGICKTEDDSQGCPTDVKRGSEWYHEECIDKRDAEQNKLKPMEPVTRSWSGEGPSIENLLKPSKDVADAIVRSMVELPNAAADSKAFQINMPDYSNKFDEINGRIDKLIEQLEKPTPTTQLFDLVHGPDTSFINVFDGGQLVESFDESKARQLPDDEECNKLMPHYQAQLDQLKSWRERDPDNEYFYNVAMRAVVDAWKLVYRMAIRRQLCNHARAESERINPTE